MRILKNVALNRDQCQGYFLKSILKEILELSYYETRAFLNVYHVLDHEPNSGDKHLTIACSPFHP